MPWTEFWDMHSGGSLKEKWALIYIEAPKEEAKRIFFARFGHNPERVTCTCCGPDYVIEESPTLAEATAFHRGCKPSEDETYYLEEPEDRFQLHPYRTVEEFTSREASGKLLDPKVLAIRADEITDAQRVTKVPEQGYVWKD